VALLRCAFGDCRATTKLAEAPPCGRCGRRTCAACKRCAVHGVAIPTTTESRAQQKPKVKATQRKSRPPHRRRDLEPPTATEIEWLAKIASGGRCDTRSVQRRWAASREKELAVREHLRRRRDHNRVARQESADHEQRLDGVRARAPRLHSSPSAPERLPADGSTCIHGMDRANCAVCNPGRFPAPIKLRRHSR
jgi:hypothetical protein